MAKNSEQITAKIPRETYEGIRKVMAEYGLVEAAAVRVLLERGIGRDGGGIREGVVLGQALLFRLFYLTEQWLLKNGEAVDWSIPEVSKLPDIFTDLLK